MGLEAIRFGNGIVHLCTVDAVFRSEDGKPISMSFHPFCGPTFEDSDGQPVYPDEPDPIWKQFNGWWRAKGRVLYPPLFSDLPPLEIG